MQTKQDTDKLALEQSRKDLCESVPLSDEMPDVTIAALEGIDLCMEKLNLDLWPEIDAERTDLEAQKVTCAPPRPCIVPPRLRKIVFRRVTDPSPFV